MKPSGVDVTEFTREKWIFLGAFGTSTFLQALVVTMQGPEYASILVTQMGEDNTTSSARIRMDPVTGTLDTSENPVSFEGDPSAALVGVLLTYYHLLSFILTPLIGGFVENLGLKNVYMFGIYIAGLTPFLSVLLVFLESSPSYLMFSFIIRGIEAVGSVGMLISVYMMITIVFPGHIAGVFAVNQAMSVIGLILGGPVLNLLQILLQSTLHTTTFGMLGIMYIFYSITIHCILPDLPSREPLPIGWIPLFKRFFLFLTIRPILLYTFSLVVFGIGSTFLQSILRVHIDHDFPNIGIFESTLIPLLPLLLQLLSPVWGYCLDKMRYADMLALIGSAIVTLSLMCVGPLPGLPFPQSLTLLCMSLVFVGLGQGALLVSSYVLMIQEAEEHYLPEDSVTATVIATSFVSSMSMGGAIGPLLSGLIYDSYGFQYATLLPFLLYLILVLLFVIHGLINPQLPSNMDEIDDWGEKASEVMPLLEPSK